MKKKIQEIENLCNEDYEKDIEEAFTDTPITYGEIVASFSFYDNE